MLFSLIATDMGFIWLAREVLKPTEGKVCQRWCVVAKICISYAVGRKKTRTIWVVAVHS